MKNTGKRVDLIANRKPQSQKVLHELREKLKKQHFILNDTNPDIVISISGDGMLLSAFHKYENQLDKVRFVGVHTGHLGFYTDYRDFELDQLVSNLQLDTGAKVSYPVLNVKVTLENGDVKTEYIDADGNVLVGDYDLVPLLDSFIKEHPDFSYHGRKGILAMTGYNGVLGYRTDIAYKTKENLQDDQKKFLDDNPDFDYDQDVKDATKVADAMKAEGWEFASHTWGHMNATERSAEDLETDDKKWKAYVAPILGDTDMVIFAFGADIGDWEGYSSDNPKFQYYKSAGYNYFCNVDSSQYFVQITDQYFRQGRRNLDGYRMYYNPDMLSDLFDVSDVWDSSRPTPVPEM